MDSSNRMLGDRLKAEIAMKFSGVDPDVVGIVLGELLAIWLVGHHPSVRDAVRETFDELVDNLMPLIEDALGNPFKGSSSH